MDTRTKEILVQVSYKGIIELCKDAPSEKRTDDFVKVAIWKHYEMLIELINRAIDDSVSNDHIMLLERLIDNSTLDSDQRVQATSTLTPTPSYDKFVQIRDRLLANQQDQIKDRGAGNAKDIQDKLDQIEKDKTK